ncbi:YbdK family carboxylate-amine ligase [Streptomyces sp. YC504]|uniref:Putative glutamate--cysteine ligase 2 n=1 Tax=Streptomyces mesophilus TaxID=1775132 RepID=A0A6G4XIR6_9ACTN|nr:glutamate--cysteine ligase [Streptomyces mesophilus]NGO77449.1 YbdK family carboxylate-amine ligase [Streptomyces mesophilus]
MADMVERSIGVEEEFLVVDPDSRLMAARAGQVIAEARPVLGERVGPEFTDMQVETRTAPCGPATEILDQLTHARRELMSAAARAGAGVVASGSPVRGTVAPAAITPGERQQRGDATFRALHDEVTVCAVHVHVHAPDRDRAVLLSNHLRPRLPLLVALAANSPFWCGRDTGYASWRSVGLQRWPVAGPPPYFRSARHYDETAARLLDTGALVDEGTLWWDIRLSHTLPTLEVRAADVPQSASTSALIAALVRALVQEADAAVDRGDTGPEPSPELLRVAYWRAARDGLQGDHLDPLTGALHPVRTVLTELFARVGPYLGEDLLPATAWLRELLTAGGGAARQRASAARGLTAVVDDLLVATAEGGTAPSVIGAG